MRTAPAFPRSSRLPPLAGIRGTPAVDGGFNVCMSTSGRSVRRTGQRHADPRTPPRRTRRWSGSGYRGSHGDIDGPAEGAQGLVQDVGGTRFTLPTGAVKPQVEPTPAAGTPAGTSATRTADGGPGLSRTTGAGAAYRAAHVGLPFAAADARIGMLLRGAGHRGGGEISRPDGSERIRGYKFTLSAPADKVHVAIRAVRCGKGVRVRRLPGTERGGFRPPAKPRSGGRDSRRFGRRRAVPDPPSGRAPVIPWRRARRRWPGLRCRR